MKNIKIILGLIGVMLVWQTGMCFVTVLFPTKPPASITVTGYYEGRDTLYGTGEDVLMENKDDPHCHRIYTDMTVSANIGQRVILTGYYIVQNNETFHALSCELE